MFVIFQLCHKTSFWLIWQLRRTESVADLVMWGLVVELFIHNVTIHRRFTTTGTHYDNMMNHRPSTTWTVTIHTPCCGSEMDLYCKQLSLSLSLSLCYCGIFLVGHTYTLWKGIQIRQMRPPLCYYRMWSAWFIGSDAHGNSTFQGL